MERSESIINISKAMLVAQKKIEGAIKDSKNPFFKNNYANLDSVMDACKLHLNDAGIIVTQLVDSTIDCDFMTTMFIHAETGEFISSKMALPSSEDIQKKCAAQTYARRFMLQAMAFVGAEDDDGNTASGKTTKPAEPKKLPEDTPATIAEEPLTKTPFRKPKTGGFNV